MNPLQDKELLTQMETDEDDDYLQVLDAGEHVFGMFVSEDEDIYEYLGSDVPPQSWMAFPSGEDIEEIISRSIVPSPDMSQKQCVEDCCCDSFTDMTIRDNDGAKGKDLSRDNSGNESPSNGRLTPTRNVDHEDHDAMSE